MMIRVLLIDDHPVVARGLESLLRANGMDLVDHIGSIDRIPDSIPRSKPAVVVSESRIQGVDVLPQVHALLERTPSPAVVMFSAFDDFSHIARAAAIGVHEYVLKRSPIRELIQAISRAASGAPVAEQGLVAMALGKLRRPRQFVREDVPLTRRELQVLQHIAMGLSNREIGAALDISIETSKEHVQNILRKLDLNDRTQAAVWAVRKSLI